MTEEKDIRTMVDEDIALAKAVWAASSYDSEVMGELFYHLMERYQDEIEDFMKGLKVIQSDDFPYERIEGGKNYPFSKNRTTQLFYEYDGYTIWGFTAQVIRNIVDILKAKEIEK